MNQTIEFTNEHGGWTNKTEIQVHECKGGVVELIVRQQKSSGAIRQPSKNFIILVPADQREALGRCISCIDVITG